MAAIILGVDPGVKHSGYAVVQGRTVLEHGVIVPPGRGKLSAGQAIEAVLVGLEAVLRRHKITVAAVEEVQWYGYRQRITLPLAHVAGAVMGLLLGRGIPVYSILASQRRLCPVKRSKRGWDEHDLDALELAQLVQLAENVSDASAASDRKRLSAVLARKICAP